VDAGKIRLIKASVAEKVTQPATRAAGLIIIISELSNIGQTQSCTPDHLDQTILETRDPSEFRRIKRFPVEESRVQERMYEYKHTPGAGFCFLVSDLVAFGESDWGHH
jgi:hypothetical protein